MRVRMENVCKSFGGKQVLYDFSLSLPESGTVCLFGPSGSGKTTLLHLLAGLEKPDAGVLEVLPDTKISYVFQEDRLLPWVSALDNVAAVLPRGAQNTALSWLRAVGLAGEENKLPRELSGGMRQRVSLARALAYSGGLTLLDEPFHALDEESKRNLMELVQKSAPDSLRILVTHDWQEAQAMADVIYRLEGPPLHLLEEIPNHNKI